MLLKNRIYLLLVVAGMASCDLERRLAREEEKVEFTIEEGERSDTRRRRKDPPAEKNNRNENTVKSDKSEKTVKEYAVFTTKYAAIMGVKPDELENGALYEYIDSWIGVPYKYAGNTKEGVDCSGFVNAVYRDIYKIQLKRSATDIVHQCEIISKEKLKEGDMVFFDISGKNSHIGIYLVNNRFIHASSSKGVIISDLTQAYYVKYWGRAGRIRS